MKNILKYIFGIIVFFGCINGVKGDTLFKCKYSVNFYGFGPATDKNYNFHLFVGDTLGDTSFSDYSGLGGSEGLGGLWLNEGKDFIKRLHTNATSTNRCPTILFIWDGQQAIVLEADMGQEKSTHTKAVSGQMYDSKVEEGKKEVICEGRSKKLRNESNFYAYFDFFKLNGEKRWAVRSSNNGDTLANRNGSLITEIVTVTTGDDTYVFSLGEGVADKFFSSEQACKNTNFWLQCLNGESKSITLVLEKPSDENNCSFGVNDAPSDGGGDYNKPDDPTHSTWTKTDGNTLKLAKKIYDMVKIIVPLLIIVLSIVDFLKVIFVSDEKDYKAAWNKLIKRIIIGLIFFAIPALIALLLNLAGLGESGILNVFA